MNKSFAKRKLYLVLNWILITSLIVGLIQPGIASAKDSIDKQAVEQILSELKAPVPSDIKGHWAEKAIKDWIRLGLVKGYQDESFRPNQIISRIEFVTMVNRAFALKGTGTTSFSDVPSSAWYVPEVKAATEAGYIQGFSNGTFQPGKQLLRVEAAVMLSRLVPVLVSEGADPLGQFKDHGSVPGYGYAALNAVLDSGYILGSPDHNVLPLKPITRAEAVVMLDRLLKQSASGEEGKIVAGVKALEAAATYGPQSGSKFTVAGSLTILAPSTTLRNLTVKGDLVIGESVGHGDVFLNNVTVLGKTFVNGGGENSVHLDNSTLGTIVIEKKDGRVRVVVGGTTIIQQMDIQTDARIESNGTSGSAIEGITITATGEVVLSGTFNRVEIKSDVELTVSSGSVADLQVGEDVTGSTITIDGGVRVASLELHGPTSVKGEGTIDKALVDAENVVFEKKPVSVEVTKRGESSGGSGSSSPSGPSNPSPSGPSNPTPPTTPDPPVDQTVNVGLTVSQAQSTGIRVALNPAIPGLSKTDFILKNAANESLAVTFAGTLDGGASYALSSALIEGATYTLSAAKTGYAFGAPVSFAVPLTPPVDIVVSATVSGIGTGGFTVALNVPVAGLTMDDMVLTLNGQEVEIAAAAGNEDGSAYAITAALAEDETYLLTIAKAGYDFGSVIAIKVPGSEPGDISVTASVYGVSATGFTVELNVPVAGLTSSDVVLTHDGEEVGITLSQSDADGSAYEVSVTLTEDETYELTITKAGYGFGTALSVHVPVTVPDDIVVAPAASRLSSAGFVLNLDKPVPELELDSFVIKDSQNEQVGVDMLADVSAHKQFEIYAALEIGETYSLSLNKSGYTFVEPLVLNVQATPASSTVGWVSFGGFSLSFAQSVAGLAAGQIELRDDQGAPVTVSGLQLGANGKSAVVLAELTAGETYSYRIIASDYLYEGVVTVPETLVVSNYTDFDTVDYTTVGLIVHFNVPVPGLTADSFDLKHLDGTSYVLDEVTTDDGGITYHVKPLSPTYSDYKLSIAHTGYDFGSATILVQTTLNNWSATGSYSSFFVGFNPYVANGVAAGNFKIMDEFGTVVPVKGIENFQGAYIVSYDGVGGRTYSISVVKDGYDFGSPHTNVARSFNQVVSPSNSGFTLMMNAGDDIDTEQGFKLNRVNDGAVGAPVAIQSIVKIEGGYQFEASLTPGQYRVTVDASIPETVFNFTVAALTTISVDSVADTGFNILLDYAIDGLNENSFQLINKGTNSSVYPTTLTTEDHGLTYWFEAALPGGDYVLKLNGHLPADGVQFQVQDTLEAGASTVNHASKTGFDLVFENPVPGLLPTNLNIRDAQNNKLSGVTLSTDDGGASYRVNVSLSSGNYTVALQKSFVRFGGPATVHVGQYITGVIKEVTENGRIEVRLTPALPQAEGGGIVAVDQDGNWHHPFEYDMSGGGATYQFRLTDYSLSEVYTLGLNSGVEAFEDYTLTTPAFRIPSTITISNAASTGIKVNFAASVDGLKKTNFVIRNTAGTTIPVSSAVTTDDGNSYDLSATLPAGKFYTVQYQSDLIYQVTNPVSFVVQDALTPLIVNVTSKGFKLQFAQKVFGLKSSEIVLRDPSGLVVGAHLYSFATKDQGLSYDFQYQVGGGALEPGAGYTLELTRVEFATAAPASFDLPMPATARVDTMSNTQLGLFVGANQGLLPNLTSDNLTLRNSKGNAVAITMDDLGSGIYKLTGTFDSSESYTLTIQHPGYDFGLPVTFGLRIAVSIDTMFQTQKGFTLFLSPAIPNLLASEITVKDDAGNTVTATSAITTDDGATYKVLVPLSSGITHTVGISRANYIVRASSPFQLNVRTASVDQVSLKGFRLKFDEPFSWNSTVDLIVQDDNGDSVPILGNISTDQGSTYRITVDLEPDVNYKVILSKPGDDFGPGIPLLVHHVGTSFEGMIDGSGNAFTISFEEEIPNMRASDFQIKRTEGQTVPTLTAETADDGLTYTIYADLLASSDYTILPVKDGFDFGAPITFHAPIIVRSVVKSTGAANMDVGFNPSVPNLTEGDFVLRDHNGNPLAITSVTTDDGGATYRIAASFTGGETYTVKMDAQGYDFGDALSAELPSAIATSIELPSESGLNVILSPSVSGLSAANFILRDSHGQSVDIADAITGNGGGTYVLSAELTGGESYTLTIAASGYVFGGVLAATIPIGVGKSYSDIGANGLTIRLDEAVSGLNGTNLELRDNQGSAVDVDAVTTADGGLTYRVQADLMEGRSYSLSLTEDGYDFGGGLSFLVPISVTKTVDRLTTGGFTLKLNQAVPGLTSSNFILTDSNGVPAAHVLGTVSEDGLSYIFTTDLIGHENYTLQIIAAGYDFGTALQLEAQPLLVLAAPYVSLSSLVLDFGDDIPNLDRNLVDITGADGNRFALTSVNFVKTNWAGNNNGRYYTVFMPVNAGEIYTLTLRDPNHPVAGPLTFVLAIHTTLNVTGAAKNGITIGFAQAVTGLQPEDVTLTAADGSQITVDDVVVGSTGSSYSIRAKLAEGSTYTLNLHNRAYDFGTSAQVSVFVPYRVTATVQKINEKGFTITMDMPVPDLVIGLKHNGESVSLTATTPDFGLTYVVSANLGYNTAYTLSLGKTGYDLGAVQTVNNESAAPKLIGAVSEESGRSITLTFDKPLALVGAASGFSIKIDSQWQSMVSGLLVGGDSTKILLTWNAGGKVIGPASEVYIAYTGVNRIRAVNQTYLATFPESPVANVASPLGLVQSYVSQYDPYNAAKVLHVQFGYSALDAGKLLREGGFTVAQYVRGVRGEYQLSIQELIQLFYDMDADAMTLFQGIVAIGYYPATVDDLIEPLVTAGYTAAEIGSPLRDRGYRSKDIVNPLRTAGISATEVAKVLRNDYQETAASAVALLDQGFYDINTLTEGVQGAYGLSNASTIKALAASGRVSTSKASAAIKALYSADALTTSDLLSGAGYPAKEIGDAIRLGYTFSDAVTAVQAFRGAGLSGLDTYAIVSRIYSQKETAIALLGAGVSPNEVAGAIKTAGDSAGIAAYALMQGGQSAEAMARVILSTWGTSLTLKETATQFTQNGVDKITTASVLRIVFGADLATAYGALEPQFWPNGFDAGGLFQTLAKGGYDAKELSVYYLKNVYRGSRSSVLKQLVLSGYKSSDALKVMHDVVASEGSAYAMKDAVSELFTVSRYPASEVMTALRTAYEGDSNVAVTADTLAAAMSEIYVVTDIGRALIDQMGVTLSMWVELEKTNAFARYGCPCAVRPIVKDSQYLFPKATIEDITIAMSLSESFSLEEIIDGTVGFYPIGNVASNALPYMTSVLRNAGYKFTDIAAVFEDKGWTDWIRAFYRYGIAASEVAAYLISVHNSESQVIDKLAPYPLKDIALVLREEFKLSDILALAALQSFPNRYDTEEISIAVAWAYSGDAIALWIKTLRDQGATASSVISTLFAHYPDYRDASKVGPALVKAGYTMDEVMKGLLTHYVGRDVQSTIKVLQQLYTQDQVTISQLLKASSQDTPQSGIEFLTKGGYSRYAIARALKEYYGLDAGTSAQLLEAKYPYDLDLVMQTIADVYGLSLETTAVAALDAQGITTLDGAITYLRDAGYELKDIAAIARNHFNLPIGDTAQLFSERNVANNNVLVQAVATAYGQTVEHTIHEMLKKKGKTAFADAIAFIYDRQQFSLTTGVKLAKEEYGLTAGQTLAAFRSFGMYNVSDVVVSVSNIFGASQNASITSSLDAYGLDTLSEAVEYLLSMHYGLGNIVRVGKEYYGLTVEEVQLELTESGYFDGVSAESLSVISGIYGQTVKASVTLVLDQSQVATFEEAIDVLRLSEQGFDLSDIILAAKSARFGLTAGETVKALYANSHYTAEEIVPTVVEIYGKPINESVHDLLEQSGITTVQEAAPFLRQMGYTLEDVVLAAKEYFGKSATATTDILVALNTESLKLIELNVSNVYGLTDDSDERDQLDLTAFTGPAQAVAYARSKGFSIELIGTMLKEDYGSSPGETAQILVDSGLFDLESILYMLNGYYSGKIDADVIQVLKQEVGNTGSAAVQVAGILRNAGYGMENIVRVMMDGYDRPAAETIAILINLNAYTTSAIEPVVTSVYNERKAPVDAMTYILDLYGITTAAGAVAFLSKSNYPINDVVKQLKNGYKLDSTQATDLLVTSYPRGDITLAIAAVYYADTNLGVLSQITTAGYAGAPSHLANKMSGKFRLTDIALAMKVLFNLTPGEAMDAMVNVAATPEAIYSAVTEVYGTDSLFSYLANLKAKGGSVYEIAEEIRRRGKMEINSDYLVNALDALGYDDATILNVRYTYFQLSRQSAGTLIEQGALLARFGLQTPEAFMNFLLAKSYGVGPTTTLPIMTIIRAGLPQAPIADIATTMIVRGFTRDSVLNAMETMGENNGELADKLKTLGFTAPEAVNYLSKFLPLADQLSKLKSNGYKMVDYIRYVQNASTSAIAIWKTMGFTATDIATAFVDSGSIQNYATIAIILRDGGFNLDEIVEGIIAAGCKPVWVLVYLTRTVGTTRQIAKAMIDSGYISLVDMVTALEIADVSQVETYRIIKEYGTREQAEFNGELSSVESKILDDEEVAVIVTISTLREAGYSASETAELLVDLETPSLDWTMGAVLMVVSGYNVGDVMSAVWDAYRAAIGVFILQTMIGQSISKVLVELKDYYRLVRIVMKIVKKTLK